MLRGREPVHLAPKAFDTLLLLVENRGRMLTKEELIKSLWPDTFVEEVNLAVQISALRKALGERPGRYHYIMTSPRRGYTFTQDVRELTAAETGAAPASVGDHSGVDPGSADDLRGPPRITLPLPRQRWRNRIRIAAAVSFVILATIGGWLGLRRSARKSPRGYESIAVLPFKCLQPEDQDYLPLAVADALITRIAGLGTVSVRPTSSVLKYDYIGGDPLRTGRDLGVDAVMDGTVQRLGDTVRVTVRLTSTSDGRSLWGESFDARYTNGLALQDSIADRVVLALDPSAARGRKQSLQPGPTKSPEAYEAYLRGLTFWNKRSKEGMAKAISYFQQAIQLDQRYAQAYSGLADSYYLSGYYGFLPRADAYALAESAAAMSIGIDDNIGAAHTVLALVDVDRQDSDRAEAEFERAITVQPDYATGHQRYSWFLLLTRRQLDRALSEMRQAVSLDPLSPTNNVALAEMLYLQGRVDESIVFCNKVIEMDSGFAPAHKYLGLDYQQKQMYAESLEQMKLWTASPHDALDAAETCGALYAAAGRRADAEGSITLLRKISSRDGAALYGMAMVYAILGEKERAFYWLEKGARSSASPNYSLRLDPRVAGLRADDRFGKILALMAMSP